MQFFRWGDDLAIRIPAAVVDALGLEEGDEADVALAGEGEIRILIPPTAGERTRLERLRAFRGRLPGGPAPRENEGRRRG